MNSQMATLIIIRGPQGISALHDGKLLSLVNQHKCETTSDEFKSAWDAICSEKFGQPCELIGITYAE